MQEIFHVGPFLGDAADALDLSDLFDPGAIPKKPYSSPRLPFRTRMPNQKGNSASAFSSVFNLTSE